MSKVFFDRDGVLKVLKSFMIILKDVRCNNLYYLKGDTITRQLTSSVDSDDVLTRLWYMTLGHTGEKYLQALSKQGLLKGIKSAS